MQKTKLEIIEETIKYYSEDPTRRAIGSHNGCQYMTSDGKKCAVGRCFNSRLFVNFYTHYDDSYLLELIPLDKYLKKEYQGHSFLFWADLQVLHDSDEYWEVENKCLTEKGKKYVEGIKQSYAEEN